MDENQRKFLQMQEKRMGAAIIDGRQEKYRADGYTNMLNKYGTLQDNSTAYKYRAEPFADDLELIRLYEGNGLFAKIINRPSEEAVKHGLDIDYGDDDIAEYVDNRLDALNFEAHFSTAEKWARLFGGAIIVMLVDDGRGLEEPIDWRNARGLAELRVFERAIVQEDYTDLYNGHFMNSMNDRGSFMEPERYHVYSMYGYFTVHRSRCLVFRNGRVPEQTSDARYRYWGIPEYVKIKQALRECITSHSDGIKLLERSVQAIYSMKNLANMLSTTDGEDKVVQRLQVIDMARGILNSIAIDADGENYDFKTLPLSGVKDIVDSACNMLSAVTDIPQTILFGRSPAGMNSTGESDMENYYNMVENIQKQNMKNNVRTVVDLLLRQGLVERAIPGIPKYKVKFAALWSMSDTEKSSIDQTKAQTAYTKAQTAQLYIDSQVMDPTEVRKGLAADGEFEIEDVLSNDGELDILAEDLDIGDQTGDIIRIITPANTPGSPGRNDESEYQAAAVLIIQDGKVLCADRSDGKGICGPGGHIEAGEIPTEAAARETMEEFKIFPLNIIPYGELKASPGLYLDSKLFFTDRFTGTPEADGKEMLNARWMTVQELQEEKIFPAFEAGLNIFLNEVEIHLTASPPAGTITVEESDGGPGSGRYPKGSGKDKSAGSLPITDAEKEKVSHDINSIYHAKYKGKRNCVIRTRSNDPDSPFYLYKFRNHGFDNYEITFKGQEDE